MNSEVLCTNIEEISDTELQEMIQKEIQERSRTVSTEKTSPPRDTKKQENNQPNEIVFVNCSPSDDKEKELIKSKPIRKKQQQYDNYVSHFTFK